MNSLFDTIADMKKGKVAVVGLGLSGKSAIDYLVKHGIAPDVFDSRVRPPNSDYITSQYAHLRCQFGEFEQNAFCHYHYVIVSPGISLKTPAIANAMINNENVFCDVELFARINSKPVLAITGSNGKSTVVGWLEHALQQVGLKAIACGNYGVPVLDVADQDIDVFVLELSSFQLESVKSLQCVAATVLNVSEDHMDRYDTLVDYSKAKNLIYSHADLCIYNQDDFETKPLISHDNLVSFGTLGDCCEQTCWQLDLTKQTLLRDNHVITSLSDFNIGGSHNGLNALVVFAMAQAVGVDIEQHLEAFKSFSGLAHRCQLIHVDNGIQYIDDSKATNVASTVAALNGLSKNRNVVLIAGGDAKGAELAELKTVIEHEVKHVIALGKDKQQFSQFLPKSMVSLVMNMEQAVTMAKQIAVEGDIVLLSPACASIDMFQNFQQRGLMFQATVKGTEAS